MDALNNWGLKCQRCEHKIFSEYTTLEYLKQAARDVRWIVNDEEDICLCSDCVRKDVQSKMKSPKKKKVNHDT
jgi:hypothetical protein